MRNGALLDNEHKEELRKVSEEFSKKTVEFGTNLLHARKSFHLNITDAEKMKDIPASALAIARANAEENKHEGWDVTLDEPVYGPFMTYCHDRELRKALYMARNAACMDGSKYCNLQICEDIVNLRLKSSNILGYKCYSDFVLEKRMAETKENVYKLLNELTDAYLPQAREEVKGSGGIRPQIRGATLSNSRRGTLLIIRANSNFRCSILTVRCSALILNFPK